MFYLFSWHDWDMAENSADVFVIKSVLAGIVIVQFKVFAPQECWLASFMFASLSFSATMMFLKVDNKSLQPLTHHNRQPSQP